MSECWCVISVWDPRLVSLHSPEHDLPQKRWRKNNRQWGGKKPQYSGEALEQSPPEPFQQSRQSNSAVSRNNTHPQISTPVLIKTELDCRRAFQKFPALVGMRKYFGSVPVTPFKKKILFTYDSFTTSRYWRKQTWKNRRTCFKRLVLLDGSVTDETVGDVQDSYFTCRFTAECYTEP